MNPEDDRLLNSEAGSINIRLKDTASCLFVGVRPWNRQLLGTQESREGHWQRCCRSRHKLTPIHSCLLSTQCNGNPAKRVDSLLSFKSDYSFEGAGNFSFEHQAAASVVEISGVGRAKTLLPSKAV